MAKTPNTSTQTQRRVIEKSHLNWFVASIISIILTVIFYNKPNAHTPFISSFIGYTIFLLLSSFVVAGFMSFKDKKKLKINFISFFTSSSIAILLFTLSIFAITFLLFSRVIMHELLLIIILSLFSIFVLIYSFICINHSIREIPFSKEDKRKIMTVTVLMSIIILIISMIMINSTIEKQLAQVNNPSSQLTNEYNLLQTKIDGLPEDYSKFAEDIQVYVNQKYSEQQRIRQGINTYCTGFYLSNICYEQINDYNYVTVEYSIRTLTAISVINIMENRTIDNPIVIIDDYRNSALFGKQYPGPYQRGRYNNNMVDINPIYNLEGIPNTVQELSIYLFFRTSKGQITKETASDIFEYTIAEGRSFSILSIIIPPNVLDLDGLDESDESKAMRILIAEEFMMRT